MILNNRVIAFLSVSSSAPFTVFYFILFLFYPMDKVSSGVLLLFIKLFSLYQIFKF